MNYYIGLVPYSSDYLEHFGVKGQKHGVRQYQNPDGSLTPAGREHYGVGDPRKAGSKPNKPAGRSKVSAKDQSSQGKSKAPAKEPAKEKKKPGRIKNWMSNYGGAMAATGKTILKTVGIGTLGVAAGVATQNPMIAKAGLAAAAGYYGVKMTVIDTKYTVNKYSVLLKNKKAFEYKKKKK